MNSSELSSFKIRRVLSIIFFLSITSLPGAARAQTNTDQQAASTTLQIFIAVADAGGAPIPPEAVPIIQGMVNCATSGTAVGTCATNIAISTALTQLGKSDVLGDNSALVTAAVGCITSGGKPGDCVSQLAASQLPPEAKPLVACISGGGNIGDCAEKAALTVVSQQLGANVPPDAVNLVNCVANGGNVATCAGKLARTEADNALKAANVPPQVANAVDAMVDCVAGGGRAADCAKNVALANIPAGAAHDLAACLNASNASAQSCVATFVSKNISDPTAAAVVGCMGNTSGDKAQQCIAKNARAALGGQAQQALQQGLATAMSTANSVIASLQINSPIQNPPKFPEQPAVLQNLLAVAQGIKDGNWAEIVKGVGPEAAEIASKIILSYFLTPAVSGLLSPVVDSMIQNDVNAFTNGLNDLGKGDAVGVAQDVFKWYETQYIQAPCALMPNGDFKNSVCNGLAQAINFVATAGGDVAKGILGAGKDVLQWLGLWNTVDDVATTAWHDITSVVDSIGNFLGLGDDRQVIVCEGWPSPSGYFSNNVMNACLSAAAANAAAGTPAAMSQSAVNAVSSQCQAVFNGCPNYRTPGMQKSCGAMASALSTAAGNVATGLRQAANAYAQTGMPAFAVSVNASNPSETCDKNFWTNQQNLDAYASKCAAQLGAHFQLPANTCPSSTISLPITGSGAPIDALNQACRTAAINNASSNAGALAGPNGAFCKKYTQTAAAGPCKFTDQTKIIFDGGKVLDTHLDCSLPFRLPPAWGSRPMADAARPPWLPNRRDPFLPALPQWVNLLPRVVLAGPQVGNTGNNKVPKVIPVSLPRRPSPPRVAPDQPRTSPVIQATKGGGGSGGAYFIDGRSGNAPTVGGSGGGKASAMDNAANAARGDFGGVAGNAGGAAVGPALQPRTAPLQGASSPPKGTGVASAPPKGGGGPGSGGSGGAYYVNGASGNAPTTGSRASSTASRPSASGNQPSRPKPAAQAPPVDYGGCPGCRTDRFVAPK